MKTGNLFMTHSSIQSLLLQATKSSDGLYKIHNFIIKLKNVAAGRLHGGCELCESASHREEWESSRSAVTEVYVLWADVKRAWPILQNLIEHCHIYFSFMRFFPTILLAFKAFSTDKMAPKLTIQVQYCGGWGMWRGWFLEMIWFSELLVRNSFFLCVNS